MNRSQESGVRSQRAKPTDGNRWVFCFPLAREARPFQRRCPASHAAILGIGPAAARDLPDATGIVIAGYGGGLRDGWAVGDVLVAGEVIDASGVVRPLHVPAALAGVRRGRLLTWPGIVASAAVKRAHAERFAADAVDMETAAVAAACAERGIPCVAVRAISDGADDALSPEMVRLIAGGRVRIGPVLAALVRRPSLLREMLRLNAATAKAGDALGRTLAGMTEPEV